MIICKNIKKSFNKLILFNNFSYTFNDSGLYILYGVSGSGKTTLMQIILGITSFDNGEIIINNKKYKNKVFFEDVQNNIAYISQDAYFINYLTIEENLKLQSNKSMNKIIEISKKFNLDRYLKKFPNELSGGEKQRFAIIGNLLQNKKIFFLDEPTASLDKENKKIFYDLINTLKKDCLIICASHDDSIFEYSQDIIDFNEIDKYNKNSKYLLNKKIAINNKDVKKNNSIFRLVKSLYKQIFRFEKKFICLYTFVFTVVLMLLFCCTNYEEKVIGSLVNNYNLKSTLILCSLDSKNYCEDILSNYSVSEVVYHYTRNLPVEDVKDGSSSYTEDFDFLILSLPYNKNNIFQISDMLLYGSYYDSTNQVILGYKKANELAASMNITVQSLVGTQIKLKLPDLEDTFKIVGIFKDLEKENDKNKTVLKSTLGQYNFNSYYYLNGKYLKKYLYDDVLGIDEKNNLHATSLTVYFKDTKSFLEFYYDYIDKDLIDSLIRIEDPVDNFVEYHKTNNLIKNICLVTSISFLVLGMIFYYQIHKTRIAHTEHNFSIFEYYGYKERDVKSATIIYFVSYIIFIVLLSILLSSCLSLIINKFLLSKNILPYSLLDINLKSIILVLIIVIIFSFIEGVMLNYFRKKKGWFYLIKEKSDLL